MSKKKSQARARGGSPAGYGLVAATLTLAWLGVLLTVGAGASGEPALSTGTERTNSPSVLANCATSGNATGPEMK